MRESWRKRRQRKAREWSKRLNDAKAEIRMRSPAPDYPTWAPPKRRRFVIVIDLDFEPRIDVYRLERTNRIDCYWPYHNGKPLGRRMGWSSVTEQMRKDFHTVKGGL